MTLSDSWTARLAAAIATAVRDFAPALGNDPVALFAVDCHPWHGVIALALLTAEEVVGDPLLSDPAEMAAWHHYNFAAGLPSWQAAVELGREMRAGYEASERPAAANAFLGACAAAVSSREVGAALALLRRTSDFRLSVPHPDDGRDFVQA
jgi:hypothetical protein